MLRSPFAQRPGLAALASARVAASFPALQLRPSRIGIASGKRCRLRTASSTCSSQVEAKAMEVIEVIMQMEENQWDGAEHTPVVRDGC